MLQPKEPAKITAMVVELGKAGVELELKAPMDMEEWCNYITHQYDITFLLPAYKFQQETAEIVYMCRKTRNQSWQKAHRS